ncbi:MAG TPA: hypothetical protein VF893_00300 [Candidatus Bathyarchaeia archaeon]
MPRCLTKTRKVGGSIVVTLTKKLVETQKKRENEYVEATVRKYQKDGFGILKGMSPFTVEDELKGLE